MPTAMPESDPHANRDAARPPQGEDHEAGIEAAKAWVREQRAGGVHRPLVVQDVDRIAAYLSRCPSPERDTDHEAEAEAVARALDERLEWPGVGYRDFCVAADIAIATLDVVRRPQQGDPAGIEAAAAEILNGYERGGTAGGVAKRAIAAYLSRCPSPERDTEKLAAALYRQDVAVLANQVEKLVEALREAIAWSYGEECTPERRDEIEDVLAEFSDAPKDSRVSPGHDPGRTD